MRSASILVRETSNQFKQDRALLEINNKLLVQYVAERVSNSVEKVILGVKNEVQAEKILSNVPEVDYIAYAPENKYSIPSGFFSTLNNSPKGLNLLIGCDMPLIKPEVIDYLFESIDEHDAIIPRYDNGGLEYLLGVYRVKETRLALKRALKNKKKDLQEALDSLDVKYVAVEKLRKIDKNLSSLKKLNCQEKLQKASEKLKN